MKKRYAAGLALALVGILSGCGQTKTQPADNTISITPVERKTDGPQMDMAVKYDFAGNHADVNGMEFRRYIWDGSAWENEGGTITVNLDKVEENEGTIRFQPESDALNAEYIVIIDAQTPESGNSIQFAESPHRPPDRQSFPPAWPPPRSATPSADRSAQEIPQTV